MGIKLSIETQFDKGTRFWRICRGEYVWKLDPESYEIGNAFYVDGEIQYMVLNPSDGYVTFIRESDYGRTWFLSKDDAYAALTKLAWKPAK